MKTAAGQGSPRLDRTGGHVHLIGLPQGKPLGLNAMLGMPMHQRSLHGI
ncbi:hypothetical protein [Glutamicibacter sp. BW77]|nr:hypothetical protein [Glutamicibacter sp. BW77]